MNHGKIITTESYYNSELASTKCEHEVSVLTDTQSLLKDVIEALSVITKGETHHLEVTVLVDKEGRMRMVRKWTV